MANKILQIDLQQDITPQIGTYDNTGSVTPNNWLNEGGVYSLGPTNVKGTTPYYWFTPTKEVTDFDLCWEDYQNNSQERPQYRFTIGDSAGNNVITVRRISDNFYFGSVNIGNLAYQTWHKILIQVRKASATTSQITAYVNGKKVAEGTENVLVTSAKIALLGLVPDSYYWQNAGQRLRYVTIYDRSYSSKGVNLDGIMTTITGFVSKLKGALSTVAFSGSYNDLSNKPTIPAVNDATLTIQRNGTTLDTFTANASVDKTINISTTDDTKIPLAGSNQISGSLIPSTDGTVNLGGSNYQWNNAYIKSLTINGVACGDILTHNAREFVDVTTAQTIAGVKTFSSNGCKFYEQIVINHDLSYSKDNPPSLSAYHNLMFTDASGWWGSYIENVTDNSGNSTLRFYVRNTNENQSSVVFRSGIDNSYSIFPISHNVWDLGTSTNKWKTFNGINPGALSLPGDAYIDIDTTNYAWESHFTFTPNYDGYCFFSIGSSSYSRKISLKTNRGEYYFSNQSNIFRFTFPIYKEKLVTILTSSSGTESVIPTIRLFPCQGNV